MSEERELGVAAASRPEVLLDLAARVEAGEGEDRELDEAIYALLVEPMPPGKRLLAWVGCFTSSLDAVVALVESALPAANCHGYDKSPRWVTGYVSRNDVPKGHWMIEAEASSPARALLAATLRALADATKKETP